MTAISITSGNQTRNYQLTHDANGNLTRKQNTADSADATTYRWDSNNRLIGITQTGQPALTASFTYDALGRRIQSSITQAGTTRTVQYLYEGQQHLGEIRDGKISHRLLTGLSLDETIARLGITPAGSKDAAASRLYLTDALNSVIAQLNDDSQGTLANSYAYSPFGESQVIGVDSTNNPVQYTSRENDGTGLIYYRARYRSPVGQWLSEDPVGLGGGLNSQVVIDGDPINLNDPLGLYTEVIRWANSPGLSGSWGHISGNINGQNYSFGPSGWDTRFPGSSGYAERQSSPDIDREGRGIILQLSSSEEAKLSACLRSAGKYHPINNNCGNPWLQCLEELGVTTSGNRPAVLPEDVMKIIGTSKRANGTTSYPGKRRIF